ncbi:uncharacterized protein M8220_015806 isoform 2-T3 [Acridotheres tristis]
MSGRPERAAAAPAEPRAAFGALWHHLARPWQPWNSRLWLGVGPSWSQHFCSCRAGSRCPPSIPACHAGGGAASQQLQAPAAGCTFINLKTCILTTMNSPSAANISSGEANRSGSDIQGPLLPQDRNPSEMDTIEDLRKKLQKLEEKNLEFTTQHNHDMSRYEKERMKLRLELQRGEALLRVLESEMSFARKDAHVQMYSAEDELRDAKSQLLELQARGRGPRHQRFRYASESQLGQSQSQDFRQALPESDLSIEAMCNRTNSASGADLPSESLCVHFEPEAAVAAPLPAPASPRDESFWGRIGYQLARTPPAHARFSDEYFQPHFGPRVAAAPRPPATDDIFQPPVSPAAAAPAPNVRWGEPMQRTYTLSASELPSAGTLYITCPLSGSAISSGSSRLSFVPHGVSTPHGPAPDAHWGEPRYRSYILSGSDIPSGEVFYSACSSPDPRWQPRYRSYTAPGSDIPSGGMTPPSGGALQGTYSMYGSDVTSDSLPSFFVPRGVSTPFGPAPDASGRDQHFSYGSDSQFDQSYSQHFGPLRPPTHEPTDLMHYRSDTDLYSFWIPFKFSLTSIPLPSGKSGKTYNLLRPTNTYVNVMPSIIHTLSDLDSSSRIRPLSTFSMSVPSSPSMSVPRRETGAGPGSSVNPSFRFRPRRASSWPPVRTVNRGISSNIRRHQEI